MRLDCILLKMHREATTRSVAHHYVAASLAKKHLFLGIPLVVITAIVGADVYPNDGGKIFPSHVISWIAISAVVLSSLQTFMKFQEDAEKHRGVGAQWESLRRDLERDIELETQENYEILSIKSEILRSASPIIPARMWSQAVSRYDEIRKEQWPDYFAKENK
ncbi:SLATT domain-containing protein [Simiduia agarivorans]|uniref:SMODS and SLOG-associating 2TM effector domain-containing protein n=1 Tax=Simiduia agarivorans (strain DSM 21679 / JCM 13881 / BCRC 17597 / SA1) TaxID=1117647 RepID=K4KWQ2_SIMAS|nr:SLATT domain-containing protein [Simiduia agarivorans]AFU98367.1 hypothetical protein M5M_05830 [Simiduia agarivorans SA1 = DSM 21679]